MKQKLSESKNKWQKLKQGQSSLRWWISSQQNQKLIWWKGKTPQSSHFISLSLYQQHQQHLDNQRTQLLNESRRRSVDNESQEEEIEQGSQRSFIKVSDVLCQLLKQQSAPDVDIDVFNCNPLNFKYFMILFREVVESRIEGPRDRLTRVIKYTTGEAKEANTVLSNQPIKGMRML